MCGQQRERYTKFNKYGFNAVINVTKTPTLFKGGAVPGIKGIRQCQVN